MEGFKKVTKSRKLAQNRTKLKELGMYQNVFLERSEIIFTKSVTGGGTNKLKSMEKIQKSVITPPPPPLKLEMGE